MIKLYLAPLTRYRGESEPQADRVEDARGRAATGLDYLERELAGKSYLAPGA